MPENGRSEREAQGFHEPRTSGGGLGVLAVVSTISVVVAAVWVMGPDDRSDSMTLSGPSSASSPSPVGDLYDLNERTIYLWDTATGAIRDLVSGPGLSDPELSPSGRLLVYERGEADEPTQIYLLDEDGVEHRLTDLASGASDPTWSPDGKIAFSATSGDINGLRVDTDIFVMEADGSHVRRLASSEGDDANPHWSPDGSRIVFHSPSDDDPGVIWVASTSTRAKRQLTTPRHDGWSAMDPAWSPNGRWIAYSRYHHANTLNGRLYSAELWLMHADGTGKHHIGNRVRGPNALWNSGTVSRKPSWSPDGRLIVFERSDWDGTPRRVDVIDARTGLTRRILTSTLWGPLAELDASWSSEGLLLVRPSADPAIPLQTATFGNVPGLGGSGIDATIMMTATRCQLDGHARTIRPGKLTLELVNGSRFEAHFTVVRLRGTLHDLRTRHRGFRFGRPRVASLEPATTEVWSTTVGIEPGRWAVLCHVDEIEGPNGIMIFQVGVVGPLIVG